jgi:DNA repair protein RadD
MLRKSLQDGFKRPLLQAPTGAGKTVIAAAIIRMRSGQEPAGDLHRPGYRADRPDGPRVLEARASATIGVLQASHQMTDPTQAGSDCQHPDAGSAAPFRRPIW